MSVNTSTTGTPSAETNANQNETPPTSIENAIAQPSAPRRSLVWSSIASRASISLQQGPANRSRTSRRIAARTSTEAVAEAKDEEKKTNEVVEEPEEKGDSEWPGVSSIRNELERIEREEERDADGGDSDAEGEQFEIFDSSYVKSCLVKQDDDTDVHVHEISNGNIAFVVSKNGVVVDLTEDFDKKVTKPPENWSAPPKKDKKEPDFNEIDNPGNWPEYIFRPVYSKVRNKVKYIGHALPTGCMPCPVDEESGKRVCNGWEIFYNGWKSTKVNSARNGATPSNLFPKERKGYLDKELLECLGLTAERMRKPDALFFFQLILPICDPKNSGIPLDPRKGFYSDITHLSNLYKHQKKIGSTYGHHVPEASVLEFLRWDGVLVRDGVRGGGDGSIYRRWFKETSAYDEVVKETMGYERWVQLKRILKLNNNDLDKKRGEEGYNPSSKYDLIYDVITSNVRSLTKKAEDDLTGDETTWGFQGYAEKGAKIVYRVMGKPGVTKGGQTVIVSASNRIRPYWYQHRHAFTKRYGQGFSAEGPAEVRSCIDFLEQMVDGIPSEEKKIFRQCPHITWDNYFSGEQVMDYAGKKGFGLTTTCRRDRLPRKIEDKYMHKGKTPTVTDVTKVARFIEPVILVKTTDTHEVVLTSFQSTSSCNIISVNAFSENKNYVEARSRGRGENRRTYVIEQNMARQLYLKTYSRIDSIDHLIKICNLKYKCWKYWHSPVNHAKALAIAVAYDMYLECSEGELNNDWKIENPVDFFTFRDILSKQMCTYDPKNQKYPGDEKMRSVTVLSKKKRAVYAQDSRKTKRLRMHKDGTITAQQYKQIKRTHPQRICNDLSSYEKHANSIIQTKNPSKCVVCGKKTYKRCATCSVALHDNDSKGEGKGMCCSLKWHNASFAGLCFGDKKIMGLSSSEWTPWSKRLLKDNTEAVRGYK